MIKDISDNPKMRPSTLATYIQAGINMHKALPTTSDSDSIPNPKQEKINGGMKSIINISNSNGAPSTSLLKTYFSQIEQGVDPEDAHDAALHEYAMSQNPNAALVDHAPSVIVNQGTAQRYFIGKETDDSQHPYIYDEGSKMVVPNSNFKQKRPEKK